VKSTYTSDELFHFVGRRSPGDDEANYQTLLKILRVGCVSHPPHGRDWGIVSTKLDLTRRLISGELVVSTVTCFCDIPVDHLALHVRKYGKFGLSFRRSYLLRFGARPVFYFPCAKSDAGSVFGGSVLLDDIEKVYRGFRNHFVNAVKGRHSRRIGEEPATPDDAVLALNNMLLRDFLAYIKPFDANLADDSPENYYLEREWRKHGNLEFPPPEVVRVIVASGFEDRLRRDAPGFGPVVFGL
jgi:abortive phage resistance protein AbiGi (putative antitoxin)